MSHYKPNYNIFSVCDDYPPIAKYEDYPTIMKYFIDKVMSSNKFYCSMVSTNPDGSTKQVSLITRQQFIQLKSTLPIYHLCNSLCADKRIYTFDFYDEDNE